MNPDQVDEIMTDRSPSQTALGVARLRAVHQLVDGEPRILDDPIAGRLLDTGVLDAIHEAAKAPAAPETTALRSRVALRSRYAEDRLSQAVGRGVSQCVILGAGFDVAVGHRSPDAETTGARRGIRLGLVPGSRGSREGLFSRGAAGRTPAASRRRHRRGDRRVRTITPGPSMTIAAVR